MVNRALHPSEIETFYILPALRRELTVCMKEQGKSQKEIAGLLGVTEAAVSQYLSSKRAMDVEFSKKIKAEIKASASRISDEHSLMSEMQHLIRLSRNDRVACSLNKCFSMTGCSACFQK